MASDSGGTLAAAMSEEIPATRAPVDALWSAHGLDRAVAPLAPDATITARTLGRSATTDAIGSDVTVLASAPPSSDAASVAAHSSDDPYAHLPVISLAVTAGDRALAGAVVLAQTSADLEARRVLGEGGMGRVLLARQRSLARDVAVKVVKPEVQAGDVVQSLVSEALLTGALEHPNIIPVHALGRDAHGRPMLVMKRIEGTSWRNVLRDPAHPMWSALVERSGDRLVASIEVLMAVCNAVHFAHARGVIHRDIKPENVMLGAYGEVYLVDWGIAVRLGDRTSKGLVGTPSYMAPEMLDGDASRVDARTDVFLLGATLHEVLTGEPRHGGATLYEVIVRAYDSAAFEYGSDVPSELAALANESCAKDAADRPKSAEQFRCRLAEWLRHRGSSELARATAIRARALNAAGAPTDRAAFDRLATECRFGFTEALRQWPENQGARDGLTSCLRAIVRVELDAENTAGARSLLDELAAMGAPDEALEEEYRAVSVRVRARARDADRARAVLNDLDDRVAYRERSIVLLVIGAFAVILLLLTTVRGGIAWLTVRDAAHFGTVLSVVTVTTLIALRRSILANEFNRRVTAIVALSIGAMTVHRWVAFARGDGNLAHVLSDDLFIVAVVLALGAVTVRRWFATPAAVMLLTATCMYASPRHANVLFAIGPITATVFAYFAQRRDLTEGDASRPAQEPTEQR